MLFLSHTLSLHQTVMQQDITEFQPYFVQLVAQAQILKSTRYSGLHTANTPGH